MPIRVLCVFACLDRGGAETMCMNLYRHIDRKKVQFDFVKHTQKLGAYEAEIQELGGRIYTAPKYKIYNYFKYRNWWKDHFKEHPEHKVVHGHFFTISAIYFWVAQTLNRKTVGHSHNTKITGKGMLALYKKWLCKQSGHYADYHFGCSRAAADWLFPNRDSIILNNAVDSELLKYNAEVRKQVRDELSIQTNLVIGTIGRMGEQKNPFELIRIFKKLHEKNPNSTLLWVGDGSLREEIERKLKDEGLSEAVIITGVRSDIDRLLQAMDVFVLPSLWEGLPVVLMEAQAAGLPCVISDAVTEEAAITDLCTFLPLGDPEKWADTILNADLPSRRDTAQEIRDAGYDIKTTAKWLEEFYLNCLE